MKKIIIWSVISFIALGVIYFSVFLIQNSFLKKSFEDRYLSVKSDGVVKAKILRCNWNIFKPELAWVAELEGERNKTIFFYKSKSVFSQNKEEWINSRTGGTTVSNTTFPQLLSMVKEDCYQFQESSSLNIDNKEIIWIYSKYDREAEERRKKEREEERKREIEKYNNLTEEEKEQIRIENEKIRKEDEKWKRMTEKEKLEFLKERFGN